MDYLPDQLHPYFFHLPVASVTFCALVEVVHRVEYFLFPPL
jgi:hypothetical protein